MSAPAAACQTTGGPGPSQALPWAGDPRAKAKNQLWRYVTETPDGAPLPTIIRDVFGEETPLDGADAALTRRFFRDHPDLFRTATRGGLLRVEPRPAAFHLTASKRSAGTPDSGGVAVSNAGAMLRRRRAVESDETRGVLLGSLAAKREATEEVFHAFEDTFTGEHLLVPFATRFNSPRRVRGRISDYHGGWREAARRHDRAVLATLTTDPARYENIEAQAETLREDVDRLRDWLGYNFNGGSRPETLLVIEFAERGLAHAHLVVFGVEYVPHERLKHYWDARRDRGSVVHLYGLRSGGERPVWRWSGEPPAEARGSERRGPKRYLRKVLSDQLELARARPSDVDEAARALRSGERGAAAYARGRRWWKLALYWATETRLYTLSPLLKPSSDGGTSRAPAPDGTPLPADAPPRWRYLGTARYGAFPAHIRRGATVLTRERGPGPPAGPPSGGTP